MSAFQPLTRKMLKEYYGSHVSGVLRGDSFPQRPQSFLVQRQSIHNGNASRWFTEAVYKRDDAAEAFVPAVTIFAQKHRCWTRRREKRRRSRNSQSRSAAW